MTKIWHAETKIGHTDGSVYSMILQQLIVEPLFGNKLVTSRPLSAAPEETAVTFSVVNMDEDVKISPAVRDALNVMSHMACVVGRGQDISVEKLQDDKEAKYIVTIPKESIFCEDEK